MGRKKYFTISRFICLNCGTIIPLPRLKSEQRELGHIKTMYCPICKDVKDFKEYREGQAIKTLKGE